MTLEVTGAKVHFEGVKAVDGVDLTLHPNQIMGLIGPNGAGKTTLLNALTGFEPLTAGELTIDERPCTHAKPAHFPALGAVRTFQHVRSFAALTVVDNVRAAAVASGSRRQARRRAEETLERLDLAVTRDLPAAALPAGQERRLGIARALATEPRYLLLDEPAAGLNEAETAELTTTLAEIRRGYGCGLLIIEHDMNLIMNVCQQVQVLDEGRTIAIGSPAEIQASDVVKAAYLGFQGTEELASA